jgi:MFS transporter, ACS family, hexuronate transporter
VLSSAAPRIEAEFHLSLAEYGWVVSAFSFCYMAASPLAGWFLDRVGLESGIVVAVAFWSVAAAFCGWARGFGQLVGARMFLGAWESVGVPAAGKLNSIYLEPKNRALGAAVTQVGLSLGGVAAPLLVRQFAQWRTAFFVCSALGLLWIPVWLLIRKNVAPYQAVEPQKQGLLRDGRLMALGAATILWMAGYTFWSNWTTLYLVKTFHITEAQANALAWFPPFASALGAFAGGWISRRAIARGQDTVRARIFAMGVSAFGCLVTVAAPWCRTPFWGTVVIAASYFWVLAGSVNLYTIPVDIWGGERAGASISVLVFAYGLLQTLVSPLIGLVADRHGFAPVCWMVALPPLGGWLLLRLLPGFRPLPEIVHDPIG